MNDLRLDDLYKMVARIYREQNAIRSPAATFSHFVEVCGLLTIHDRKKKRENASMADALCKALGWYFPLMAKFRIESIEELIFRKFPYACPYCRLAPHEDGPCKLVKGEGSTVDHSALRGMYRANQDKRPKSLNGWQKMFDDIYPRSLADAGGRSSIGLLEELGELAEAIRVYEQHPKYLLGEAADTFSYLMGLANEFQIHENMEGRTFSLEDEFLRRYPGLCPQCGYTICVCPAVPDATVGRMAKELDIGDDENLFIQNPTLFLEDGRQVALRALDSAGGYPGLASQFPFDRGDANKALLLLCIKLADAVGKVKPDVAETLRGAAIQIGNAATYAGSPVQSFDDAQLIEIVRETWRALDEPTRNELNEESQLANEIGSMIGKVRILFVGASPREQDMLRVAEEYRVIDEALKRAENRNMVELTQLNAPTVDDFRRAFLDKSFDIVHLAGHGDKDCFLLHGPGGESPISLENLRDQIGRQSSVSCVILNSCNSASSLKAPIGPLTIGMDDSIDDEMAVEFSRGFYDAIGAGKDIEFAVEEGKSAAKLKGVDDSPIVLIQ